MSRPSPTAGMQPSPPDSPARRRWLAGPVPLALAATAFGLCTPVLATSPAAASAANPAVARPREVETELPEAMLLGQGRLRFLGLSVYDARLWVAGPFDPAAYFRASLALELVYTRRLVGRLIAERSLEEMQRAPGLDEATGERWLQAMTRLFPDVTPGDRLTGVQRPGERVRFFFNGALRGDVADPEFARRFISIWLGPQTSQPTLRQALLGGLR